MIRKIHSKTPVLESLFFNKVVALRPATLLKKKLWHRCFSVNFAKFSRTTFLIEHLWWLLLYFEVCFVLPFWFSLVEGYLLPFHSFSEWLLVFHYLCRKLLMFDNILSLPVKLVTTLWKKLNLRCLIGFRIRLCSHLLFLQNCWPSKPSKRHPIDVYETSVSIGQEVF